MTAEELRSEPIGRDRLGHSYWLTQDPSCNFRIYQEHLDEEIWQVVASNRSEMETLISRLKGNEVVLPSLIGVIDEDSSSNSCANAIIKPPPPEEQDDSQSSSCGSNSKAKVPNIKIKIENGNVMETNGDLTNGNVVKTTTDKPIIKPAVKEEPEDEDEASSEEEEEEAEEEEEDGSEEDESDDEGSEEEDDEEEDDAKETVKKNEDLKPVKPPEHVKVETEIKEEIKMELTNGSLKDEITTPNGKKSAPRKLKPLVISNSKVSSPSEEKVITKKRALSNITNGEPETEQPASKKSRPTLSDDRRGKKSKYEKSSEEEDDEEEGDEDEAEEEEEDEEEDDDEAVNGDDPEEEEEMENEEENEVGEAIEEETLVVKGEGSGNDCESSSSSCFLRRIDFGCEDNEEQVGEAIEEEVMYIYGEGSGQCCLVGNPTEESNESILIKESKEIDLQSKTKPIDLKLSKPDENKNDESKNCMTNGEISDNEKKVNSVKGSSDAVEDEIKTTIESEKSVEKNNDLDDSSTQVITTNKDTKACTNNHKSSDSTKLNNQENATTLKSNDEGASISEKDSEQQPSTGSSKENNNTAETKDLPKSNFDLDRSTEPPDIQPTEIPTNNDDSSVQPDFSPANSRKRRLSEDKISRELSESESDLHSDSAAPPTEEEDIGGKRPKMRLKVVNTELRKKVEAERKSHEDSKSTSEEEGAVQEEKKGEDGGEENDPLKISELDVRKAEAVVVDNTDVPKPVLIQTRTTRHTPAGTPVKPVVTQSARGRKKAGKQRYTKRSPGIPSLEPETAIVETETKSEDDPDSNKMPKLEPATGPTSQRDAKLTPTQKKPRGRKRDIDTSNIIDTQSEIPVRQSRRIAQLKIREEAERRKLEEEALKKMKAEFKKKKKEENTSKGMTAATDTSEKSEEDSEAEEGKKFSTKKKGGRMWKKSGWSSGPDEPEEDDEYDLHHDRYDSDRGSPLFKSDHEFSPESDIEDESQAVPLKRARTVRKEGAEDDGSENLDESCQKCGKNDHPEWILLCDNCDKGYHCSCLSPVLFIIPEGDWFCPPCQQEQLITALKNQLTVLDEAIEEKRKREEEEAKRAEVEQKLKDEEEQAMVKDEAPEKKEETSQSKKNRAERAKRRSRPKKRKPFITDDDDEETEESDEDGESSGSGSSSDGSESASKSSSKTSDSEDNEPIYKLRKRRQVNVSYRLNEYEDLINSAIKEEMDEVAGAGNLGRGKDISTIIEADKEEKMRQKQMTTVIPQPEDSTIITNEEVKDDIENGEAEIDVVPPKAEEEEEEEKIAPPVKIKSRSMSKAMKKKSRKLNNLDISSDDDGSDEDFKTSSYETEEDESISEATDSDSSLEVYRKRGKKNKKDKKGKSRRPQRRAARERRRLDDFIVEDSEWSDEGPKRRKTKRKHNWELQDTESEDEMSDQIDSEELCDDTTDSEDSDGCWRPSKRRKTKGKTKGGKSKSAANRLGPRGGKQPRKFNKKSSGGRSFKSKSKSKSKYTHDTDDSDEDVPRTRGKRFTYLDSFDEESSDDGIKPGVKRPDTPPEEREKFIKKQEEIKRMLAEKNTEAAKAVATPTLAPVDSLSTVPLSVIKGAKALDLDYLQRKGELNSEEGETDFDEDLPDDFDPEAMDEEEIAKMMEEEDFAQQQLKLTNDVVRPKKKENEPFIADIRMHPIGAPPHARESSGPQLQEPPRKRLPMPTIHPPLSGMPRFLPPGARLPYETPIRQHLPSTVPLSMQAMQSRPMASGIGGGMPPVHSAIIPSVVGAPSTHPIAGQNQNAGAEAGKPRGRRKKITPLRDTLQKQQAAAAAAAAAGTGTPNQPSNVAAVKDPCLAPTDAPTAVPVVMGGPAQLSVAQPPQLYAPPTSTPPSVITRMPQVSSVPPPAQQPPLLTQGPPQHRPPRPPFPDQNSRFYSPPNQIPPHRMSIIRHGAPMPPPQHHPLGPNFASGPPPLRPASPRIPAPVGNAVVNRQPSPRPLTTFASNDQYGAARPPPPPPPQQHPTPPHAYRPPLYGTPGYPPAPPQQSQTPMHPTGPDYSGVPTSYGPTPTYGGPYYPPPPPPQQNIVPPHSTPPAPVVSSVPISSPVPLPTLPVSVPASTPPQPTSSAPSVTTASTPPHALPMPVTPVSEPTIVGQTSQPPRPKASVLETFDSKSRSPLLEAEVQSSPYSNSAIAEDQEEEDRLVASPPANTTSEFSGLVSYFSSQHDDLNS